jgi:hypothetical protein
LNHPATIVRVILGFETTLATVAELAKIDTINTQFTFSVLPFLQPAETGWGDVLDQLI